MAERAQRRRRMKCTRTDLKIVRLKYHTPLPGPISLQRKDEVLKGGRTPVHHGKLRFRRLKCAGNVATPSGSVNPNNGLTSTVGTAGFAAVFRPLGRDEIAADRAPDGVADIVAPALATPAAQQLEAIPSRPDQYRRKNELWQAESEHQSP